MSFSLFPSIKGWYATNASVPVPEYNEDSTYAKTMNYYQPGTELLVGSVGAAQLGPELQVELYYLPLLNN